jgi:endonuclease/exonuclease/phosphatase family metal-dependent hydrolase
MKIISLNYRGVAGPSKKVALKRLVASHQPDILMLQETMGESGVVATLLESLFPQWEFTGLDARGRSGGLEIGWSKSKVKMLNSWGFESGLGVEVCYADMGRIFTILNIYGPYQDRVPYWESLTQKYYLLRDNFIIGGDLNLSLGTAEVWGLRARVDPLMDFFHHILSEVGLSDLSPLKLSPSWRNKRTGEDCIAKRLDRFLISDKILNQPLHFRQWIGSGGESDHSPIFFDIVGVRENPLSPFKFNWMWEKEEIFQTLVKECWEPFN